MYLYLNFSLINSMGSSIHKSHTSGTRKALLLLIFLGLFFAPQIYGAELFRKQTGTATIAAGAASVTVTIPAVCMTQSFLVFSVSTNDPDPGDYLVGGRMTNATTLTFSRFGTGTASTIKWQVFEFEGNVTVQSGTTNLTATPINVAITAVDLTKTFVIATMTNSGGGLGSGDSFTADLTSTTNLRLSATNGTANSIIYWQVIQYQDAVVKKFSTNLPAGTASTTTTIVPAITTLSKAMVISNHTIGAGVVARDLPRTELTNSTTVTYTRGGGTNAAMNFVTYVVEFTDLTTVERATVPFTTGSITRNRAVTAAASSGLFGPGNQGRQGSTDHITDDNLGHAWFNYELTTLTNLLITRAVGTGSAADAPYQLVTFEDQNVSPRTYYSFASGAWESNTSWSLSSDGSSGAVGVGVYPRRSDNVVIRTGHNITINSVTDNGLCGLSPDNLSRPNVGPFPKSSNIMFYQTGDILISGTLTVVGVEMMIEGYTKIVSGGTFTLASDLVNLGYLEADAGSTFSTLDDISLAGNSTTIINTNSISSDDLNISFTNATLCGTGSTTLTNGLGSTVTYFNGATVAQICTTFTINCTGIGCSGFPVVGTNPVIIGNSGPGGVGSTSGTSDLKLWFKVDNGLSVTGSSIDVWTNSAGISGLDISESGGQRPTLVPNALNGFGEVSFSGTNRLRTGLNLTTSNFVVDRASSFVVIRADNTTQTSSVYLTDPLEINRFSSHIPWEGSVYYDIGNCCGNDARLDVGGLTGLTGYSLWTYDATPATGKQLYRNGSLLLNMPNTNTYSSHATHRFNVGGNTSGSNGFQGDITEILIFISKVNTAQRIIIDNYLTAKFGLSLSSDDIYTMDDSGNGNFDYNVAGIGQASDGSNHRDAKGSGVVRMWNPNNLGNGEFLIWGHNNLNFSGGNTDVDGVIIQERIRRVWRVSEVGEVGTVSVSVDLSGTLGSALGNNLRLLIDRDGDGFADNDVTPVAGSFSGTVVTFSGINLQNGDRFTIGNTDLSNPLPIQLISFNATAQQAEIKLQWSTSSELNNDFFTIQRSKDAESWEDVIEIKGAGTSSERIDYEALDGLPYAGISYYRLKQTDFDKQYSYSGVRRVEVEQAYQLKVYPNPSSGIFRISTGFEIQSENVKVINLLGQTIPISLQTDGTSVQIDSGSISAGVYVLQVTKGYWRQSVRIVIE
jgi:hypothetical protein